MGRNILKLDTSGLEWYLAKLDTVGGNVKKTTSVALKKAAVKIQNDTVKALAPGNLPAGGKYSTGKTNASVIHFPSVEWEGLVAWVPVGFDFGAPGAGGFLIAGTPRMKPDAALRKMYKGKGYMNELKELMAEEIFNEMTRIMEG